MTTLHATSCVVCAKRPPEWSLTCSPCRNQMRDQLRELVDEYARLDTTPGASTGQRVSGTRTAPLPVRLDVLSLVGPGSPNVTDPHGDQIGELPTAVWLDSWCRDWRDVRGQGETLPGATVSEMTAWLDKRLDWAADEHPAVEEFADELRCQLGALRAVNRSGKPKPEQLDVPCPRCETVTLSRENPGDYVECSLCRRLMTELEYRQYCAILIAERKAVC